MAIMRNSNKIKQRVKRNEKQKELNSKPSLQQFKSSNNKNLHKVSRRKNRFFKKVKLSWLGSKEMKKLKEDLKVQRHN